MFFSILPLTSAAFFFLCSCNNLVKLLTFKNWVLVGCKVGMALVSCH